MIPTNHPRIYLTLYIIHSVNAILMLYNKTMRVFVLIVFVCATIFFFGNIKDSFAATVDVTITGSNSFSPSAVTINAGDTVRWTVQSGLSGFYEPASDTHLVHYDYPDPSCQNDTTNCFDGPILYNGGPTTYSFTFMIAGTWYYHDHQSSQGSGQAGPASIAVSDTRAPAAVSNLASSGATQTSISLTWTSPGDDQGNYVNYGTPTTYDVRYSTATITSGNWDSATQATGEPSPSVAGTSQSMTVSSLSAGTTYYFAIKTRDEVSNESALSNILTRATVDPADTTAPASVSNLSLSSPTEKAMTLSWTSPGDDGNSGTAQSYDTRYSTSLIIDSNWSSAVQVAGEPAPAVAGTSQSMIVSGLSSGVTYYFGLKAIDESSNESSLSNIPILATITPSSQALERFGDITSPEKILDLQIIAVSTSTAELSWTASGDDEKIGRSAVYDMRYAQKEITLGNWPFIIQATGEPAPQVSGTKQSMIVLGLGDVATYYFAVSSKDEVGNESAFSNVVSTTTLALPLILKPPEEQKEQTPPEVKPPQMEEIFVPTIPPAIPPAIPPIVPVTEGDVIRARGDDKVYAVKNGRKIWIPNPFAFNSAGYDWGGIKEIDPAYSANLAEALLIREEGRPEVYAIDGEKKRHIPNIDAFNAHGYKWEDVLETRAAVAAGYETDSRFVQSVEDFKIFLKIWIEDLEKSLNSPERLMIVSHNIDAKIYLRGWIVELKEKLSALNDIHAVFYREIASALTRADVEFCLTQKYSGEALVELCLNTQYYGGGGLGTLFKAIEEKVL